MTHDEELTNYKFGDVMSPATRAWILEDIRIQNEAEPENERRDLPPQDISDAQLFLLWLRS